MDDLQKNLDLQERAEKLTSEGKQLAKAGEYEKAIFCFDQAIELCPGNDIIAWFGQSYCFWKLGFREDEVYCYQAISEINESSFLKTWYISLAIDPSEKEIEPWNNRGVCVYRLWKNDNEANALFDKAIEAYPQSHYPMQNKAQMLSNQNKTGEAMELFEKAAKLNPVDVYFWLRIAFSFSKSKKYEQALLAAEKALTIAKTPDELAEVYEELGENLKPLERYEEAIAIYDKWLELKYNEWAWASRGSCLFELGRYDEAVTLTLKEAEKYSSNGQYKEALEWYSSAEEELEYVKEEYSLDYFPAFAQLYKDRSNVKKQLDDTTGAAEDMEMYDKLKKQL